MAPEPQSERERSDPARGAAVATAADAPVVLVAARNEADRLGQTLVALAATFPGAPLIVADDSSTDATGEVAVAHGARIVGGEPGATPLGKGGNVTRAARSVLDSASDQGPRPVFLLCDADLGSSAAELRPLVTTVAAGQAEMAVAAFERRVGGGFGLAVGYAHRAIERLCGFDARAPISGQRALSAAAFRAAVPFAPGFGMEIGITVDVVRGGMRVVELELPLEHRATGRTVGGFRHRARQLRDFRAVYRVRRG